MSFTDTPDFVAADPRDTTFPRFYMKPVQNNFESDKQGKPVFEEREYVEIHIPGDRKSVVDRAVKDEDRRRWPQHYAAFKAGQEVPLEGTPIGEWAAITRSQAEELKFAKVLTVETLARLPDEALNAAVRMGGFQLREKAQRFLEQAKGSAPMEALAAENAQLRARLEAMEGQFNDFKAQLAADAAKAKVEAEAQP